MVVSDGEVSLMVDNCSVSLSMVVGGDVGCWAGDESGSEGGIDTYGLDNYTSILWSLC